MMADPYNDLARQVRNAALETPDVRSAPQPWAHTSPQVIQSCPQGVQPRC